MDGIVGKSVQFQLSHSFDVRDSGTVGELRSGTVGNSESTGSRVAGNSESTGSRVVGNLESAGLRVGKTFQIDSVHEFPRLQSDLMLHGDVRLQKSSIDVSSDSLCNSVPLCNSIEVAIDNRQSNSNSNSKSKSTCMLGGDSKSKIMLGGDSKSKIKNTCIDEDGINGNQSSFVLQLLARAKQ